MDIKSTFTLVQLGLLICLTKGQTNVALTSQGSKCEASHPECVRAFDGVSSSTSALYKWGFYGEAQGIWINVTFSQKYTIYVARFMQLSFADESNFQNLQLHFDDGAHQQITLTVRQDGFQWEEFTLNPPVETTSVNVYVLTAYTTGQTYNGFVEVEFYNGLLTTTTESAPTTTPTTTTEDPSTTTETTTTPPTTTTTPSTTTIPPTTTTSTTTPTATTTTTTTPSTTTTTPTTTTLPTTTTTTPTTTMITTTPSTSTTESPTTTTTTTTIRTESTTPPPTSTLLPSSSSITTPQDSTTSPVVTTKELVDTTDSNPTSSSMSSSQSSTTDSKPGTPPGETTTGSSVTESQKGISDQLLVAIIIVVVFGVILVVVVIVLFIRFCCRSGKGGTIEDKKDLVPGFVPKTNGARPKSLDYDSLNNITETPVSTLPPSSSNQLNTDNIPSRPIQIPDLGQVIIRMSVNDGFGDEFREIPSGETGTITAGRRKVNLGKNRFRNIFPFDYNRSTLSRLDDSDDTDYINASYIKGYDKNEVFIASQGPNKFTIADFWRMIWENNCAQVVMVTNLYERGKQKCDKYWPDEGSETFGLMTVKIIREETFPSYTVRDFELTRAKSSETKLVQQYHYTSWPDEGVPDTCTDVLSLIERVKSQTPPGKGPIVIHCSAGVGRTGTYIALSNLYKQANAEGEIDIFKCAHLLRAQRMNMVQSLAQYRFIYLAMIEWLECKHVSIPCDEFPEVYSQIQKDPSVLQKQYQTLDVFIPRDYKESCEAALQEDNKAKNRDLEILPSDDYRPILSPVEGRSDYINAVFTKGYRKPFAQLITQMPFEGTVIEFWRMVSDFKVQAVVMLNSSPPDEQPYWPVEEGQTVELDALFTLSNAAVATAGSITITDVYVTNKEIGDEAVLVKHFRLTEPPPDNELPKEESLLDLYHTVAVWMRATEDGRMAVHCLKGYERSGLFCATHHMVEKVKNEQEVDVFNAVKQARQGRPELIPDMTQYSHLYKVAEVYLQLFDNYSNFRLAEAEQEEEEEEEEHPYINVAALDSIVEEQQGEQVPEENNNDKSETTEINMEEDQASIHHLVIEVN